MEIKMKTNAIFFKINPDYVSKLSQHAGGVNCETTGEDWIQVVIFRKMCTSQLPVMTVQKNRF